MLIRNLLNISLFYSILNKNEWFPCKAPVWHESEKLVYVLDVLS